MARQRIEPMFLDQNSNLHIGSESGRRRLQAAELMTKQCSPFKQPSTKTPRFWKIRCIYPESCPDKPNTGPEPSPWHTNPTHPTLRY